MPKVNLFSKWSFSAKLSFSLLLLALVLLALLYLIIIPKMQKEQYDYRLNQVNQTIDINTQELKLSADYLIRYGILSRKNIKDNLNHKFDKIQNDVKVLENNKINEYLFNNSKTLKCNITLVNQRFNPLYQSNNKTNDGYEQYLQSNKKLDQWLAFTKKDEETFCPSITRHIVQRRMISKNESLIISCNTTDIYVSEYNVEEHIKEYVQKSFSFTKNLHKGNTFLMWININDKNINKTLFNKNDKSNNDKYCVSQLSSVSSINTGLLSAKDILSAANKNPIRHFTNTKEDSNNYIYEALTWVKLINSNKNRPLVFITTVYEKDLKTNHSIFLQVLPVSFFAFIISLFIAFLLVRKFFKSLDILLYTSKKVGQGKLNYRSNIKGKDQIGILGRTFDSMLDAMQNNIKILDLTVKERTLELEQSLDEKNTLLKEIHHRVKNNLAFTINLIKLQKRKVNDKNTKDLLSQLEDRIYIMELLHRKLYESDDLSSIPFKKYINELVEDICLAYDLKDVQLELDIDDISLDIEYAMPCGLIINECITNAYKYAFSEKDNIFRIIFKKENNKCTLIISDNGKGLTEGLNINKTKSLGLRLITSISKGQLLGDISYIYDEGAKFIITFDIES